MGHLRVEDTLRAVVPGVDSPFEVVYERMPGFSLAELILTRPLPVPPGQAWFDLRWFLVRSLAARRAIRRSQRDFGPDVVHLTTNDAALLLRGVQRDVPCVISTDVLLEAWTRMVSGVPEGVPTPRALRPLVRAEQRALRAAPLVIPWTETVAADVRAVAPATRTEVLHPGIDTDHFRPASGRPAGGKRRILFVGGRFSAKGGPELIQAVRALGPGVELDVVTTEPVPPAEGVVVHRAGPGTAELVRLFQQADIFCLPTRVDAVPWVILEAMSCGVPVVSNGVGSITEMVPRSCGRVVEAGDGAALVEVLLELVESPSLRRELGQGARAHVERVYDARRNTRTLLGLLEEVAAATS
jgi:glycosyltransferase involved in cell wall biosynthesis